jgi:hypothetical protein
MAAILTLNLINHPTLKGDPFRAYTVELLPYAQNKISIKLTLDVIFSSMVILNRSLTQLLAIPGKVSIHKMKRSVLVLFTPQCKSTNYHVNNIILN